MKLIFRIRFNSWSAPLYNIIQKICVTLLIKTPSIVLLFEQNIEILNNKRSKEKFFLIL